MRYRFLCKYIFICSFFLNALEINSTPEVLTEEMKKYLEVIELIMEKNKVDIANRGLYKFSSLKFKSNCEAEVKLEHYSPLIDIFKVNICKKTSILSKAEK